DPDPVVPEDPVDPDPVVPEDPVDPDPVVPEDPVIPEEPAKIVEDFAGIGSNSGFYARGSFESAHADVTWSYYGRTSLDGYAIDGEGLMLRDGGYLSGTVSGGVGSVSVQVKKAFTNKKKRVVYLSVNGIICNWAQIDAYSSDAITLSCDDVNRPGDVSIKVEEDGQQVVIDNLTWTSYSK
ncbi:MAG: hypothetical protein IJ268_06905, partial [Proteobacteria bacterium]|nr:hypothetical protein [Pseudomonadota bacterium]